MPKKITELTAAQRARFGEWADKWTAVGLRTGAADREKFDAAARACYRFANLEEPKTIIWVQSPIVMTVAAPIAAWIIENAENESGDGSDRDALIDAVKTIVLMTVGGRGEVNKDAVINAVIAVLDSFSIDVNKITTVDKSTIRSYVLDNWWKYIGGQFWAAGYWYGVAWSSFFREVCDLDLDGDLWDRAKAYERTVESACWWWPHRTFIIATEHPSVINIEHVDQDGGSQGRTTSRLHCETGPAIAWPDGWGIYAVHGVRVPAQVVDAPETLTAEQITAERNAEVRRVMLERFGFAAYLDGIGAVPISEEAVPCRDAEWCFHDHEQHMIRLYRAELEDDEPLVVVKVTNSSPEPDGSWKQYVIRVPPEMTSARAAIAWTFGLTADEYQLDRQS